MTKSDQPMLSAYIVSRCPFGLQMQRIMANIVESIPEAAEYLEVRYIGSAFENGTITSMHGKRRPRRTSGRSAFARSSRTSIGIYVRCYMKEGKSEECLKTAAIGLDELNSCTDDISR
jgi:hypothetical protein